MHVCLLVYLAIGLFPAMQVQYNNLFIVNSWVHEQTYHFYVSAMFAEEEARKYTVTFRLVDRHIYNHNVRYFINYGNCLGMLFGVYRYLT